MSLKISVKRKDLKLRANLIILNWIMFLSFIKFRGLVDGQFVGHPASSVTRFFFGPIWHRQCTSL